MKRILLALFLAQAASQDVGVVEGIVHDAAGKPAQGVRVYAIEARGAIQDIANAPFEGLTLTDPSGRFRLEISTGRYYVATGSVSAPTFYPGAANPRDAQVVTVSSGRIVEFIDFSSFVPPRQTPVVSAGLTGVLSGTLHFTDGSPAASVAVAAVPASLLLGELAPP